MSRSMTRPAVERTRPPIKKTGTRTSMPIRMPAESEIAPTMGRTMSPGMIQIAPMENPSDLERAGMAKESDP